MNTASAVLDSNPALAKHLADLAEFCSAQATSTLFTTFGLLDAAAELSAAERILWNALMGTLETRLGVDVEDGFDMGAQTHFEALLLAADDRLLAA